MLTPIIVLEEHFFSEAYTRSHSVKSHEAKQIQPVPGLWEKLADLGSLRLQHIEAGQVALQVVSHGPTAGCMSADDCKSANDQLAAAVMAHPTRFAGFAVLPMNDPEAAMKFVGALINNHERGPYYDGLEYRVFWKMVQELHTPVYLHTTSPSSNLHTALYTGNFLDSASLALETSALGWHSDVALHVLRLFASDLFDELPNLKVIIGHMREMLPFMLDRVRQMSQTWGQRQQDFKEVWDKNIWITTSGVWSVDPLASIIRNTKMDHILDSVDYPFSQNEDGLKFLEELEKSRLLTQEQFAMVAYRNAEKLLRVKAV